MNFLVSRNPFFLFLFSLSFGWVTTSLIPCFKLNETEIWKKGLLFLEQGELWVYHCGVAHFLFPKLIRMRDRNYLFKLTFTINPSKRESLPGELGTEQGGKFWSMNISFYTFREAICWTASKTSCSFLVKDLFPFFNIWKISKNYEINPDLIIFFFANGIRTFIFIRELRRKMMIFYS